MWRIGSRLSQIKYRFIVLIAVPILFELVFVTVLVQLLEQSEQEMHRQDRAREVVTAANTLSRAYYNTGIMLGAYGVSPMNPLLRLSYHRSFKEIAPSLEQLHVLVSDNPNQQNLFDQLTKRSNEYVRELESAEKEKIYLHEDESFPAAKARFQTWVSMLQAQMTQLNGDLKELTREEADLANQSVQEKSRSRNAFKAAVAAGVVLNIILAVVLAIVFNRTIQKRLETLMDNATRLASGQALHPQLLGNDEIAELDTRFRDMAAALEEARSKERAVVDNAQDVICSIDASGKFSEVSPAAETLWGYKPADLLGMRCLDLIASDDKAVTQQVIKQMMRDGNSVPIENRLIHKDGSIMDVLWSTRWSKQENSLFCVIHDITQRKRAESLLKVSEERTRSVIENIPTGIITVGADGLIESINPRAASIFKCEQSDLRGKDAAVLFATTGDAAGSALNVINECLGATKSNAMERECTRLNGSRFPAEISATEFHTLTGNHFLLNIQDITERREIEQLKQDFLAMVSHDLRTPLTSVLGILSLLNDNIYGTLTEKGHRSVHNGILGVERLINLINDLLDMEKLEHGSMTVAPRKVKMARVIERSIDSVKALAEQQHIIVCDTVSQANSELFVMADEDRLVQVLVNLLSNAIKFSPENAQVEVSAAFTDGLCKVTVKDYGRGVPENFREAIFEKFRQVEASDGKRGRGTGLGLPICKKIIDCHNGQIGVENNNGSGSCFWFTIAQAI